MPEFDTLTLLDHPYGTHPRQCLDVYRPVHVHDAPVVLFFHGGGFIRGDKRARENLGRWGAAQGWVTVLANYRLAPQHPWPSGPEDVVAAWKAVVHNAAAWGGDARRVVLMGESAGAAHVAAAALMRRFQTPDWAIRGAVLMSGPYDAALEATAAQALSIAQPDIRNEAYFGDNRALWPMASIVDQIDAAPFPVLIAAAERDLLQMQVQAGQLFACLVRQHGFSPQLRWWPGHDHFTPGASVGTDDTTVSAALLDFVQRVTQA